MKRGLPVSRALGLGEAGEMTTTPQLRNEFNNWVTAPQARQSTRWRARCNYVGHDGVRRTAQGFAPKKNDAIANCRSNLADKLRVGDTGLTQSSLFVVVGKAWLAKIARPGSGKSIRTLDDYTRSFYRHVDVNGSMIRGLSLAQVNDPQRLRRFLEHVADSRGTGSAKMLKSVLSGILTFAVNNGVLQANALRQVGVVHSSMVKPDKRDRTVAMSTSERNRVVAYAYDLVGEGGLDPRSRRLRETTADFVALMAGTGVRIGEARALSWADLDLESGALRVRGTKSQSADRTLYLPGWLVAHLVARAARMSATDGLIFQAPNGGNQFREWEQSNCNAAVRSVLDGAGMEWAVPHSFRRTVATILHEAGIPLAHIADQLGHADPSMTARVYLGRDAHGEKSELAKVL